MSSEIESCALCAPDAKKAFEAATPAVRLPLCQRHWNNWLLMALGGEYDMPCGAYLIDADTRRND